jgi:hypothetical protein
MAQDQIALQRLEVLAADNLAREKTKSRVDAIDDRATVDDLLDDSRARVYSSFGCVSESELNGALIYVPQRRKR